MSDQNLRREMRESAYEPLLPVEKKLIVGSIALGLALLVVLAIASHILG